MYLYYLIKEGVLSQENEKGIFVKIMKKIDEGKLGFQNSFNQITQLKLCIRV